MAEEADVHRLSVFRALVLEVAEREYAIWLVLALIASASFWRDALANAAPLPVIVQYHYAGLLIALLLGLLPFAVYMVFGVVPLHALAGAVCGKLKRFHARRASAAPRGTGTGSPG